MDKLIGQKVGRLTVLRFLGIEVAQHKDRLRNKFLYECKCECGNLSKVNRPAIKNKSILSCGCLQKEKSLLGHEKQKGKARPHVQKPNGESILHASFLKYRDGANKRKLLFLIDKMKFAELTSQNCYYCNSEPKEFKKKDSFSTRKMNGIDRVDSSIGYITENCVPCCKICNYMKQELSEKEFYEHILKIKSFRGF
jgi:hypothetical protein